MVRHPETNQGVRVICAAALRMMACAALLACASSAKAQTVAEFYRGKTLRMIIGYGAGGGYDLYARLVAQYLPKHIPGNPQMIPQNMPGGGSFVAAKFLHDAAPKDGTHFGSLAQTLALDSAVDPAAKMDVRTMPYIGRITSNIDIGVASEKSGIRGFGDVRLKTYTVGASGGGSTTVLFPSSLNKYAGARFNLVRGYAGTTEIQLAMERGEVDIIGAYGLPGMLISQPGWIKNQGAALIYQAAVKRHRLIPDVPALPELASDGEGRDVLFAVASTGDIGRSILTTPGVPPERLAALRAAFQAMLRDPEFTAAAAARSLMLDEATGEEIDGLVRQTLGLSAETRSRISELMK